MRPRTPAGRAKETLKRLTEVYPGSAKELCALQFETPFQLLVATILSAQTTDERVNMTTPDLFAKYPDAHSLAAANPEDVEVLIKSTGFFRNKTKSIIGMAQAVCDQFDGELPESMDDLVKLPGVGRKTANVLLSVAWGDPGLPVDTHVTRLSHLLKLTEQTDAVKIETDLCRMIPPQEWGAISLRLILHGRAVCIARRPKCEECVLNDFCPSAFAIPAPPTKSASVKSAPVKSASVKSTSALSKSVTARSASEKSKSTIAKAASEKSKSAPVKAASAKRKSVPVKSVSTASVPASRSTLAKTSRSTS